MRVGVRCGLERLDDQPVQPDATRRRQPFVERVPDQDVREAETAGRPGDIRDDTLLHRLVERPATGPPRRRLTPGQDRESELTSEDGREDERRGCIRVRGGRRGARSRRARSAGSPVARRCVVQAALGASSRTISPTNNGLPSVSSCSAATSSSVGVPRGPARRSRGRRRLEARQLDACASPAPARAPRAST